MAFLSGFIVQKGAEYPDGDPRKKFKYRVVLRGNDIKDQSFEWHSFKRWLPRLLRWKPLASVTFWAYWNETRPKVET